MAQMVDTGKTVDQVLTERGSNYGSFDTHAAYSELINNVFESSPNWATMKADGKEALRIIANKVGRILNGNPEYDDNWRDIAGYATLVLKRIESDLCLTSGTTDSSNSQVSQPLGQKTPAPKWEQLLLTVTKWFRWASTGFRKA